MSTLRRTRSNSTVAQAVEHALQSRQWALSVIARATYRADQARLEALVKERAALPAGFGLGLGKALQMLPIWVIVLMLPIAMTRCIADADPLMGVYGYALCPQVCEGCSGRVRVEGTSGNGARYYCLPSDSPLRTMSDKEFWTTAKHGNELASPAAFGSTFLILFTLLLPVMPFRGLMLTWRARERSTKLTGEIEGLAWKLQMHPPPNQGTVRFGASLIFPLFCLAFAAVLVLFGLVVSG